MCAACLAATSCADQRLPIPSDPNRGVLTGNLGPAVVPARIDLVFKLADRTIEATARSGMYEVELPTARTTAATATATAARNQVIADQATQLRHQLPRWPRRRGYEKPLQAVVQLVDNIVKH